MRPLNQPGWAEVWPFVAGILRENPAIIEALEIEVEACDDILSSRLRLLADCLGEFLGCLSEQTTEQVRFKALGERTMESVLDLIAQEQPEAVGRAIGDFLDHLSPEANTLTG